MNARPWSEFRAPLLAAALCLIPATSWAQVSGAGGNIPLPPEEIVERLSRDEFEIVSVKGAGGGLMGAKRLKLRFAEDGLELKVKWKRAPDKGEGWNNSPRYEIGAYEVQKLFLDSEDYVVPVSVPRCIPVDVYVAVEKDAVSNYSGADCVFGLFSIWLENVKKPNKLLDAKRFGADAEYARGVGDLNVLTYLINHQDGRKNNFLISTTDGRRRLFSIDNGLAFSPVFRNVFTRHWNKIRVPALPRETVERLREVGGEDLVLLGVLAQMEKDEQGVLQSVQPGGNRGPRKGTRQGSEVLQLGLTQSEIEAIEKRLAKLLERVEKGEVPLLEEHGQPAAH
jgi:hypothetical protein